jgi:hypothetical protein
MKSRSLVRIAAAAGLTSRAGFHGHLHRESAVAGKACDGDRMSGPGLAPDKVVGELGVKIGMVEADHGLTGVDRRRRPLGNHISQPLTSHVSARTRLPRPMLLRNPPSVRSAD